MCGKDVAMANPYETAKHNAPRTSVGSGESLIKRAPIGFLVALLGVIFF
jgi:hypothetical protein